MDLGLIGALLGAGALIWATLAPRVHSATLLKAFKALERDVDDMWDKVESHLGRISRLKRTAKDNEEIQAALAAPGAARLPATLPRPVSRSDIYRRWRDGNVSKPNG